MARAFFALGVAVYSWVLLAIDWFIHVGPLPTGPDRGLASFRRAVLSRSLLVVGAAGVLAAVLLAVSALRRGTARRVPVAAMLVAALWLAAATVLFAAGRL